MKELKIGEWYYMMLGYGGSGSQYVNIRRKTNVKTGEHMFSLFGGKGGEMRPLPVTDVYEAVAEDGVVHHVSANDLAANGHIGIGSLEEPKYGHVASICRSDALLLVETGRYTQEQIEAEFPFAFGKYEDEAEANAGKTEPMTDKQEEILKAAYAANCEKKKRELEEENRRFREEVASLRQKYAYIPCPKADGAYLSVGDKRRNVLAVLKHEFPGVKFRVTTRNGSTSDSISVEYTDGPAENKVTKVVEQFETTQYNAYEDYHESVSTPASVVCGGFDYVFVHRNTSKDVCEFVHDYIMAHVGGASHEFARGKAAQLVKSTDFPAEYELKGMELDDKGEWHLIIEAKSAPLPPEPPKGKCDGVTVTENTEKGGIEIRFPSMPSDNIRDFMKSANFRWSRFSKCGYNRATDENRKVAAEVVEMWNKENGRAAA